MCGLLNPQFGNFRISIASVEQRDVDMGGCQNYGPFLGTQNIRCRTILGTQKGTIILTTTRIC